MSTRSRKSINLKQFKIVYKMKNEQDATKRQKLFEQFMLLDRELTLKHIGAECRIEFLKRQ